MIRSADPKQLLRQLGNGPAEVDAPEAARARRKRVVAHLEGVLRQELGRREGAAVRRTRLAVVALAAAVILVVAGVWLLPTIGPGPTAGAGTGAAPPAPSVEALAGRVSVAREGADPLAATERAMPLQTADEVSTGPAGAARIALESGATVQLAPRTRVQLSSEAGAAGGEEQLELRAGRVEVAVPPLGTARTLSVRTIHGRAVVHGTRFSVELGPSPRGAGLRTVVKVAEGLVVVHASGRESRLGPGSSWSSDAQRLAGSSQDAAPAQAAPAPGADEGTRAADRLGTSAPLAAEPGTSRTEPPAEHSTLAEQNRLFAKALDARQRGDDRAVVAHLDELIRRYPESTLLPEARLERSRALKRLGNRADGAE